MKKIVPAILMAVMLCACTTTLKVQELDGTTNRFATSSKLTPEEVKVAETFDVDNTKSLLFLRTNYQDISQVGTYFEGSVRNFGFFDQVLRKDDFERYLIANNLQDQIGDVSGFSSLSKASGLIGDFLFADLEVEFDVGYQVRLRMDVYNARDARKLYSVHRQVTNWAGLDGPLFQPVLNGFFDWIETNSDGVVSAAVAAPEPVADAGTAAPDSADIL